MSAVTSVDRQRMTVNDWESGALQNDWRNDWDSGFLHCIANAPRTRAAFDMRFFSCPARARGAGHEIISEVRSLFMRGAFDRQQSILQFIPNIPYWRFRLNLAYGHILW